MLRKLTLVVAIGVPLLAQAPPFLGMGDSIGEGAQSADANFFTQPNSYLVLIARQMKVPFPQPLIVSSPFGEVGSTFLRGRLDPTVQAADIAVSGQTTTDFLTETTGVGPLSEKDLVLPPRIGTQLSIGESLGSPFVICWIGSNDALSGIIHFDHLDASQVTPIPVFDSNYQQIIQRLSAAAKKVNGKVMVANVPDVTSLGFLLGPDDLKRLAGSDFGLPQGSFTTVIAMLLLKSGLANASLLQNPNWVLDPTELKTIQDHITAFNVSIAHYAGQANIPVVDINLALKLGKVFPLVVNGVPIAFQYLGGALSLDGVHPSNIGYAILANVFIFTANLYFNMNIPYLDSNQLASILCNDPFVDFNHSMSVRGRPFTSLLETLLPFLGISGNSANTCGAPPVASRAQVHNTVAAASGAAFMQKYNEMMGKDASASWTQQDAIEALRHIFGLPK